MNGPREFQAISERTQGLLAIEEGLDVPFKREMNGLETSDLGRQLRVRSHISAIIASTLDPEPSQNGASACH